ncbi:MAG: hypothetical protein ABJ364_14715 [Lentilitoribacter sp.]
MMGEIAFSRGDVSTSFLFYEQALEINPTGGLLRGNYGLRLMHAGQTTHAAEELQLAIDLSEQVSTSQNAYLYLLFGFHL